VKAKDTKWLSFEKRILGNRSNYDEDYFCYERNPKYLDILAATKDDVLDLMYFIAKLWEDQIGTKENIRSIS
jgi:hypothetical protein